VAIQINGKTAKTKTVPIKSIKAGEVFFFSSAKSKENTGNYIRINSKEGKGLNLNNFKSMKFTTGEVGVVKEASMNIAD
jgi:hypothetical protein